jgi:hypothetical protein
LLRGLPAITVSPDDSISLLGSPNVKIYVDGRPYLGDSAQYLRTLHGSDVDRIEVMTNPSAQFSAEGSAGIINFVLRKKRQDGVSGTVSEEVRRPGGERTDASVKVKDGKWAFDLSGAADSGRQHSTYGKLRSTETQIGGPATIDDERGGGSGADTSAYANAKATYDIDPRTSLSASFIGIEFHSRAVNRAHLRAVTPDFASFDEFQALQVSGSFLVGELAFNHKGNKEGETLTASFTSSRDPHQVSINSSSFSNGGSLFSERVRGLFEQKGQVDWQHPMGKGQILSVGGTWNRSALSERYHVSSDQTPDLASFAAEDLFSGTDQRQAAYATFQQPVGSWTFLPGLRVERDQRRVSSPGHSTVRVGHTDVFPTLHVDHALSKALSLTVSYAKRIDRPDLGDLRPYAVVQDVLNVQQGNPHLRNQSTDAYEINLHYRHRKLDVGVLLYDRETSGLWGAAYTQANGIVAVSQINSGHRRDSGAEIDLTTPILRRVKVNASVNLYDQSIPVDRINGGGQEERFRYSTNTTLEWDGADHGGRPGDVVQLQWMFNSRYRAFDIRNDAFNWLSLSYTHNLSRSLFLTATADYQSVNRHQLIAPLVQEEFFERRPVQLKLKLAKSFGKS